MSILKPQRIGEAHGPLQRGVVLREQIVTLRDEIVKARFVQDDQVRGLPALPFAPSGGGSHHPPRVGQVLDARKQREAGQPHWSLAPAGGRSEARGCLRLFLYLNYQSISVVGMTGGCKGRELLLPSYCQSSGCDLL